MRRFAIPFLAALLATQGHARADECADRDGIPDQIGCVIDVLERAFMVAA